LGETPPATGGTSRSPSSIGRPKIESARERLLAFEPQLELTLVPERFTSANARELLSSADIVVDCTDNYEARFLANDAAVLSPTTLVHGSIFRYEGQLTVIAPGRGPCLRCIYPEPPADGTVPSGAEAGVPGFAPGVLGAMQAAEVVKLIAGIGEPLIGRLLLYDSLWGGTMEMNVSPDPNCPVCGDQPTIISL
jgi:adenylyltransferase/sulfurtransferase